jgi:hypothetical protein
VHHGRSSDGGHLNSSGRQRIALGWYAVAAELSSGTLFADGFESGDTGSWSVTAP